jgi:hypothetical protein
VLDPDKPREFKTVFGDGRRVDVALTHDEAFAFAKVVAKTFGIDPDRNIDHEVGPDREVPFDKELAKKDVSDDAGGGAKKAQKTSAKKGK